MSLFDPVNLICPKCGSAITMMAVGSVNADRRPDFRDAIMANRFQDVTCGTCEASFRLQPRFNYLDAGRGQWIAAMPAASMPDHLEVEDEAADLFERSYGAKAPKAARMVGENLSVRITFGWPAVREKLLAVEHGLDDAVLEMVKLAIIRNSEAPPLAQGVELRLTEVTEDSFIFYWLVTHTEKPLQSLMASREMYDAIVTDPEGWAPTRARLENGSFVDLQKLFMGEGRPSV